VPERELDPQRDDEESGEDRPTGEKQAEINREDDPPA
jgi:hypothetical protein